MFDNVDAVVAAAIAEHAAAVPQAAHGRNCQRTRKSS
jgi:hypothetical protein